MVAMIAAMLPNINAVTIDPMMITKLAITVWVIDIGHISPPTINKIA